MGSRRDAALGFHQRGDGWRLVEALPMFGHWSKDALVFASYGSSILLAVLGVVLVFTPGLLKRLGGASKVITVIALVGLGALSVATGIELQNRNDADQNRLEGQISAALLGIGQIAALAREHDENSDAEYKAVLAQIGKSGIPLPVRNHRGNIQYGAVPLPSKPLGGVSTPRPQPTLSAAPVLSSPSVYALMQLDGSGGTTMLPSGDFLVGYHLHLLVNEHGYAGASISRWCTATTGPQPIVDFQAAIDYVVQNMGTEQCKWWPLTPESTTNGKTDVVLVSGQIRHDQLLGMTEGQANEALLFISLIRFIKPHYPPKLIPVCFVYRGEIIALPECPREVSLQGVLDLP